MTPMTLKDYLAMSACYGIVACMFALIVHARHGRTSRGANHAAAIRRGREDALNDVERRSIVRLNAKGWSQRSIADRLGRSQSAIGAVVRQEARHG